MNGAADVLPAAIEVVEDFVARGRAPRDAMADSHGLRATDASTRAKVARLANAAIAGSRRGEFVVTGDLRGQPLGSTARARVWVFAAAVELGITTPEQAAAQFQAAHGVVLPFAALQAPAATLSRVPDATQRFAIEHSVPDWFATRALAQFGADAAAVATALAAPAPRTVRANLLVVKDRQALAAELATAGIPTRLARHAPTALHVNGDADLFATAAYRRGAFEQQDEASQLAASLVLPPPAGKVLDLCAGSGGKTLAIAAALHNRGVVLATDVHAGRLAALRTRLARAKADNVQVAALAPAWPPDVATFAARADRILVDAPCSGTGSWRRRPEARWTVVEPALAELQRLQDELLATAAAALRPGARLVYATCSLLAAENEDRVAHLSAARPDLEVVRIAELLGNAVAQPIADATGTFLSLRPDRHDCDGFFAAVLRRKGRK